MRTMEQLLGLREELIEMLKRCQAPEPEGLWQLSDWCITMQSIIDVESQLKGLYRATSWTKVSSPLLHPISFPSRKAGDFVPMKTYLRFCP
jgi:hypothetical protein